MPMHLPALRRVAGLASLALVGTLGAAEDITVDSFRCITDMTPVRGFYVDNLDGDLDATLAVARSETGGRYPPGSVVQLIPTEIMLKREPGFSAATNDWEFFELNIADDGSSSFRARGTTDVVNQFGGNCLGCHSAARPEWDMVCEQDHGCAPVPLTREMIVGLQQADARCKQED